MSSREHVSKEELKPSVYPAPSLPDIKPAWAWATLAALIAYQAAMYGWVMRVNLHWSVVLMPWLLRQPGYRLYETVISQHAPGSIWFQTALYGLIPDPILRARLGMITVTALCTGLVFHLARQWWGRAAGLVAATLYGFWGPVIMDHLMYYEVLVGSLALAATAVWNQVARGEHWRPLIAGLLVGLAVLTKQQGLAVVAVFIIWRLLGPQWRTALPDLLLFLVGAALPVGLVMVVMAAQGRLDEALFWTWTYNTRSVYIASTQQSIAAREVLLLAGWLAPTLLFAVHVVARREQWQREGILLMGLLPALCTPAYPRYGRFHLSGAVPIVALIGAGALAYAWQAVRQSLAEKPVEDLQSKLLRYGLARVQQLYMVGVAGLALVALVLPTYYRLRLGPLIAEVEPLIALTDWLSEEAGVSPGTRIWIVPDSDATENIYAIGGYLPPTFHVQTYGWFQAVPGVTQRLLAALEAAPPQYVVVIEKWRVQVPAALLEYVDAHYRPIDQTQVPNDYGTATLYHLTP